MSIEFEGAITKTQAKLPDINPMTALGDAIYGPEAVEQMINLTSLTGRLLASAVVGTARLASMIPEVGGVPVAGVPKIEPIAQTVPTGGIK